MDIRPTRILFRERILPVDLEATRVCGAMIARCEAKGIRVGVSEAQIVATGIRKYGHVVVTENMKDFTSTAVQLWNIGESDWPLRLMRHIPPEFT